MSKNLMTLEMDNNKFPELSLRDIYYNIFRQKWKIILTFLLITGIIATYALTRPEIYRSEAKLMIQIGRENATLDPTATTGKVVNVNKSFKAEVKSELEILNSRDLAEGVVDVVGMEAVLKGKVEESDFSREKAILEVLKSLKYEALDDSNIIHVSYEAKQPKFAQMALSKFLDLYLEKHIAVHQIAGSYQFFDEQTDYLRTNLTGMEDQVRFLRNKTGIASPDEYRSMHLERVVALEREIEQTEVDIAFSLARVETLEKLLENLPENSVQQTTIGHQNSVVGKLRERLLELQLQKNEIAFNFDNENRKIKFIQEQISQVQALLNEEKPTHRLDTLGPNPTYQNLQLELLTELSKASGFIEKSNVLKQKLENAKDFFQTLTADEVEIRRLLRELSINEESYRKYAENLEQVRINHALNKEKFSNINVVQPANLPLSPVGNAKHIIILLGVVLGAGCAVCTALTFGYIDHSIITPEQVKNNLGLTTLTSIHQASAVTVGPRNQKLMHPKQVGNPSKLSKIDWAIPDEVSEEYTTLYQHLRQGMLNSHGSSQVIAVASCSRGEGVSAVAANLATMLAQQNKGKTLLIDTNFDNPSIHNIFKREIAPGLTDVREENKIRKNSVQSTEVKNLFILPAGKPKPFLPKSFQLDQFQGLLEIVKDHFEFVVVDIPSLRETKSAISHCGLCDGVVLVVESERLRWEVIKNHKDRLTEANSELLGVVLNKRRYPIPEWVYRTL